MRSLLNGRGRFVAAALVLSGLLAAPAQAAGDAANPLGCTPKPTLSQSFAPWGDTNQYTPVTNAGFEAGVLGWTVSLGANVVVGNEPWKIGGAQDRYALELANGASAVSAPLCIDETYPHFRLFVRNAGTLKGALRIEVLYLDKKGRIVSTKAYDYKDATAAWQPTGFVGIDVFGSKKAPDSAPVAFRFTASGNGVRYQIDDVYVDPRLAK